LPSQSQLVLIYRPRMDGRLSRPWCKVAQAEIQTRNLPTENLALYHTATSAHGGGIMHLWPSSVCPVPDPQSRMERCTKLTTGMKEANDMGDQWCHLEVKKSNTCREGKISAPHNSCFYRDINVQRRIIVLWLPSWNLWVAVKVTTCRGWEHVVAAQLVIISQRFSVNSYPFQLVPNTRWYPDQLVPTTNSYPSNIGL